MKIIKTGNWYKKFLNKKAQWENVPSSSGSPGYPPGVSDADVNRAAGPDETDDGGKKKTLLIDVNWDDFYKQNNINDLTDNLKNRKRKVSTFKITFSHDPHMQYDYPKITKIEDGDERLIYTDTENEETFLILENYFGPKIGKILNR